jgi:hypothetical protein
MSAERAALCNLRTPELLSLWDGLNTKLPLGLKDLINESTPGLPGVCGGFAGRDCTQVPGK